jgi:thioredoxin reductase (NADPH)
VVIGNSDYAAEEALHLLSYTSQIKILSHGKEFSFNPKLQEALGQKGIELIKTARLSQIYGEQKVEKIISSDGQEFAADGVFMAVGIAGANAFAKKLGLEMEGNYIKVDKDGLTNLPGVFAAGDCTGSPPQVASSVGNGCNAALSAIKLIRGLHAYIQYN